MVDVAQKVVLTVPASKMKAFLAMLRQFDYVQVELLEEIIKRYIRTAPKNAQVSDEEIADILMEIRYGKSKTDLQRLLLEPLGMSDKSYSAVVEKQKALNKWK